MGKSPFELITLRDELWEKRGKAIQARAVNKNEDISFEEYGKKIAVISGCILELTEGIEEHNLNTNISLQGNTISLRKAIILLKNYREERDSLTALSFSDKHNFDKDEIEAALCGVQKNHRELNKLIRQANISTQASLDTIQYEHI